MVSYVASPQLSDPDMDHYGYARAYRAPHEMMHPASAPHSGGQRIAVAGGHPVGQEGGVGLSLIYDPSTGRALIRRVREGSSAARTGRIHVGDELLSVNGHALQNYPPGSYPLLLMGPPGTAVEIGFRPHSSRQVHHIILHRTVQTDHPPPPPAHPAHVSPMILPPSHHHHHHPHHHQVHQVQQYSATPTQMMKPDGSRYQSEWPATPRDERGYPAPRDDRLPPSAPLSQGSAPQQQPFEQYTDPLAMGGMREALRDAAGQANQPPPHVLAGQHGGDWSNFDHTAELWSHGDPYGGHFLPLPHHNGNGLSQPGSGTGVSSSAVRRAKQRAYSELAKLAEQEAVKEEGGGIMGVGITLLDGPVCNDPSLASMGLYGHPRTMIARIAPDSIASANPLLHEGDQVVLVDHSSVAGMSASHVEALLFGEEHSVVIISVLKEGEERLTHATLVRERERDVEANGAGGKKRKEIYDIGITFSVDGAGKCWVTGLAAGGPAERLGFLSEGDQIVAIDEEALPAPNNPDDSTSLPSWLLSRLCGAKGSPVVLTVLKGGAPSMRAHIQLRRTHLFGSAPIREKGGDDEGGAQLQSDPIFLGEEGGSRVGGGGNGQAWINNLANTSEMGSSSGAYTGGGPVVNPVHVWKTSPWRPTLPPSVLEDLQDSVNHCLSLVSAGACICYGMLLIPSPANEPQVQFLAPDGPAIHTNMIQVGDVVKRVGGEAVSDQGFDGVVRRLRDGERGGMSLPVSLARPSHPSPSLIHTLLQPPAPPPPLTLRV